MNFVTFPVGSTNIFPIANSSAGGQLVTEFNLRSRESVGVGPYDAASAIEYMIGPSYVHSQNDFEVRVQTDGAGTVISTSTLEILPGKAVINGHFVECLSTMTVDLLEGNMRARREGTTLLKGTLCIGLRAMYSTLPTLAGTIMVENSDMMYEGIQVVVLPRSEFKLPTDVPKEPDKVTAHIKLAEFNFINSAIGHVTNNYPAKCKFLSADRINGVDRLLSDVYISKSGLNPKKLYTFSGKGNSSVDGRDTWCDSTDSLMVWDVNPQLTFDKPTAKQAAFGTNTNGKVQLYLPHKQVDGMVNSAGKSQYYAPRILDLPVADYNTNTPGTVDKAYTNQIKQIANQLQNIYRMPNGKQLYYIETLSSIEDLPDIGATWDVGDYILVGEDLTLDTYNDSIRAPSTMYVVLPGIVKEVKYAGTSKPTGVELGRMELEGEESTPNTSDPDTYNSYWGLDSQIRGNVLTDYFVAAHTLNDKTTNYYYTVSISGIKEYSNPVFITGEVPFAQEDVIGGFLNVPDTALDNGYIYRDDSGHLRLLDYALLRSGTLAYQLGQDFELSGGLTTAEIQSNLVEYVNQRIAFPNSFQLQNSDTPNVINITLDLTAEESPTELNIANIDSRFGCSVYIHINGTADSNTTINITDCEKVRIDNNIGGSPVINLHRCTLYYDASILEYLNEISELKLWYERFEDTDPNLLVDYMTVREVDAPIVTEDVDFWNKSTPNDNHYTYALQSITFGSDGSVIGCSMYVRNESSTNIELGSSIITSEFELPQGAGLSYPKNRITRQLKVTGSFVNAYPTDSGYMVLDTNFTALSQTYITDDLSDTLKGTISFLCNASIVNNIKGFEIGTPIDGWENGSFHIFSGGVIS